MVEVSWPQEPLSWALEEAAWWVALVEAAPLELFESSFALEAVVFGPFHFLLVQRLVVVAFAFVAVVASLQQ